MEIIDQVGCIPPGVPSVVTVGVFDGVHLGHQKIMNTVISDAARHNLRSVAITFDRNPVEVVHPSSHTPYITTLDQKLELIASQGLDMAVVLPLVGEILDMPARDFATYVLHRKLHALELVVGTDFAFGKGRSGNVDLLGTLQSELGYELKVVPPVMMDDTIISSTVIRQLISDGSVSRANELLGHPFTLHGVVVAGDRIGRTIGFPTANIKPALGQILPACGVYSVTLDIDGCPRLGVANVGTRPTVNGDRITVEVYIIGFSGDIYGQEFSVEFRHRLRDELLFGSIDELKRQIALDVEQVLGTKRVMGIEI